MAGANKYLKEVFIPQMNRDFTVQTKEKGTAFTELLPGIDLNKIFCKPHERQVRNDNTVSYKNITLQIPESSVRHHFVRCTVTVYEHLDGTISIGYGPKTIGHYSAQGALIEEKKHSNQPWLQAEPLGLNEPTPADLPTAPSLHSEPMPLSMLAYSGFQKLNQTPQVQGIT